jgi:hypothetical protein
VLQPLASLSRTWAAAMMRCRPGTLQSSGVSIGARHASPLRSRSILARAFSCSLRYEGNVRDNPRNRCERAITELRLTRSPRVWLQSSWRKAPAPRAAEAGCPCRGSKSFPQSSAFLLQSWASYCSWPLPLGGTKYSCKLNFDNSLSRKRAKTPTTTNVSLCVNFFNGLSNTADIQRI